MQLEVISGPSAGVHISQQSKKGSGLTLTVGRILQNDLVLNDPEVSGKHALISWNSKVSFLYLACWLQQSFIYLHLLPHIPPGGYIHSLYLKFIQINKSGDSLLPKADDRFVGQLSFVCLSRRAYFVSLSQHDNASVASCIVLNELFSFFASTDFQMGAS